MSARAPCVNDTGRRAPSPSFPGLVRQELRIGYRTVSPCSLGPATLPALVGPKPSLYGPARRPIRGRPFTTAALAALDLPNSRSFLLPNSRTLCFRFGGLGFLPLWRTWVLPPWRTWVFAALADLGFCHFGGLGFCCFGGLGFCRILGLFVAALAELDLPLWRT